MRVALAGLVLVMTLPAMGLAQSEADSSQAMDRSLDPDLKAYVDQLVPLVFALGDGDTPTARAFLEEHLYYPENPTNGVFGGKQGAIDSQVSRFEAWQLDFESVDFIRYKRLSSQGYTVMLIGNGNSGPVMFVFTVFHHRGRWQLNEVSFQLAAAGYRNLISDVTLEKPLTYTRSAEEAETDETRSAGASDETKAGTVR